MQLFVKFNGSLEDLARIVRLALNVPAANAYPGIEKQRIFVRGHDAFRIATCGFILFLEPNEPHGEFSKFYAYQFRLWTKPNGKNRHLSEDRFLRHVGELFERWPLEVKRAR